jgi:hypothetical protein
MRLESGEKMAISENNEPVLNTLHHYGVCQKVLIYFDTNRKALDKALCFKKKHMWGMD